MAAKRNEVTRAAALVAVVALMGAGLSGCGMGRALGLSKSGPDEFAVVTKAPLVLPPDYNLRPPKPGAKRPQELAPSQAAKEALLKNKVGKPVAAATPTSGEKALLAHAGAANANPGIRKQIERDNKILVRKSEKFTNRLLFGNENAVPASATESESERLRQTAAGATDQSGGGNQTPTADTSKATDDSADMDKTPAVDKSTGTDDSANENKAPADDKSAGTDDSANENKAPADDKSAGTDDSANEDEATTDDKTDGTDDSADSTDDSDNDSDSGNTGK